MANRYWRGGSGTWNTTLTTNWSATSGGAGGASVPTAADSVFFDQADAYTVTMTGALNCLDITVSAGTVTFATGTTPTLRVAGGWSTISSTVWNSTGAITFASTTARTINANNITINAPVIFNGVGGTWGLLSNLTLGTDATCTVTLTAGTINLNNLTLTGFALSSSGTGVRTILYGSAGQIILTGNNTTIINWATMTNFTVNPATVGTLRIHCNYTGSVGTRTILIANLAAPAVSPNYSLGTGTVFSTNNILLSPSSDILTLTSPNFQNFDLSQFSGTLTNSVRNIAGNFTLSSGLTLTAGSSSTTLRGTGSITTNGKIINFPISIFVQAAPGLTFQDSFTSTSGLTYTGGNPGGVLSLNDLTITANSLTINAFTSSINMNFGTSGQILLTGNNSTIFNISGLPTLAANINFTGNVYIASTYTGSVGTRNFQFSGVNSTTLPKIPDIKITGSTGIILGNTATDIITVTGSIGNIDLTGLTNTFSNNNLITIFGNLTIPATGGTITASAGTNTLSFSSTTSQTIDCNGRLLNFPINFNGTAGTFVLNSELRVDSTKTTTLTAGTLNLNNNILSTGIFTSSNSNARTIAHAGTGELRLTGNAATIFDITTATNFTSTGTAYVNSVYAGATGTRTFTTGLTEAQARGYGYDIKAQGTSGVVFGSGTATDTVAFAGSWNNLDLTGLTNTFGAQVGSRVIYGNITLPATGGTIAASGNATQLGARNTTVTITSNGRSMPFDLEIGSGLSNPSNGQNLIVSLQDSLNILSQRLILNNGTLALNDFTVTATLLTSTAGGGTACSINFGTSGQFNLTNSGVNGSIVSLPGVFTFTGTPRIYSTYTSGGANTRTFNMNTASFDVSFGTSGTGIVIFPGPIADNVTLTGSFKGVNLTGFIGTLTNTQRFISGNLVIPATGGTLSAGTAITYINATGNDVTTNGRILDFPITFQRPVTNIQTTRLLDSMTIGATRLLTIGASLNLNGQTLTTGTCLWGNNTGTLTFNGGSLVITGSGATAFSAGTNGLISSTGDLGTISMTSATAKTFVGNGRTYNCTLQQAGTGALSITGANTFNDINATTRPSTITFPASIINNMNNFSLAGISGSLVTVNSSTAGTRATINKIGGDPVPTNFLSVRDISFTPYVTDGTAPVLWYLGDNSTNVGNNIGAVFTGDTTQKVFVLSSGSTWTTPSDFNVNDNTVHIIGGGGGGGGSLRTSTTVRVAGAGGGGGGYSKIDNLSGSAGQQFSYSIGLGGAGRAGLSGAGPITSTAGGNTVFNGVIAAGGGAATTSSTLSTGGAGGAGTIYTGGAGGKGSGPTASTTVLTGGGGGGGAAGPLGNGGNGGNGFGNTTAAQTAAGGGGGNGGGTVGGNAVASTGGTGGNNAAASGGGISNTAGTNGGGGGGASSTGVGRSGGAGIDIANFIGSGGGSGGTGAVTNTAVPALYGAGGAGAGTNATTGIFNGSSGAQGVVVIVYTIVIAPTGQQSNMLLMFR
jgi:hypothetical protein